MSTRKGNNERKCILIDRDFQFKYLMTWILMTMGLLAGLVLASVTMFYLLRIRTTTYLAVGNGVCAIALTLASIRLMIGHSHRIAGSAFRLERSIRHLANGTDTGYVTLRRKDYLKNVAAAVNYLYDHERRRWDKTRELGLCARRVELALADGRHCEAEVGELINQVHELENCTPQSASQQDALQPVEA